MFKVLNEYYYLDLDAIEEYIQIKDAVSNMPLSGTPGETHLNVIKYETVKMMLEVVMSPGEDADETLGAKSQLSMPFKIAFNTLLNKKLIKSY